MSAILRDSDIATAADPDALQEQEQAMGRMLLVNIGDQFLEPKLLSRLHNEEVDNPDLREIFDVGLVENTNVKRQALRQINHPVSMGKPRVPFASRLVRAGQLPYVSLETSLARTLLSLYGSSDPTKAAPPKLSETMQRMRPQTHPDCGLRLWSNATRKYLQDQGVIEKPKASTRGKSAA